MGQQWESFCVDQLPQSDASSLLTSPQWEKQELFWLVLRPKELDTHLQNLYRQQRSCSVLLSDATRGLALLSGFQELFWTVTVQWHQQLSESVWFRSEDHKATHLQTKGVYQPMLKLIKMSFSTFSDKADITGVTLASSVFPSSFLFLSSTPLHRNGWVLFCPITPTSQAHGGSDGVPAQSPSVKGVPFCRELPHTSHLILTLSTFYQNKNKHKSVELYSLIWLTHDRSETGT